MSISICTLIMTLPCSFTGKGEEQLLEHEWNLETPTYLVADGKATGPSKRRVEHLEELDRADGDDNVLGPSCAFEDRVFISNNKERKWLK